MRQQYILCVLFFITNSTIADNSQIITLPDQNKLRAMFEPTRHAFFISMNIEKLAQQTFTPEALFQLIDAQYKDFCSPIKKNNMTHIDNMTHTDNKTHIPEPILERRDDIITILLKHNPAALTTAKENMERHYQNIPTRRNH